MSDRPANWLNIELSRAREELQRMPRHLGGKGNRWAWFTGDELSDIHNALLHAQDGTGTAPAIIEEIRAEWRRIDA